MENNSTKMAIRFPDTGKII